MPSIKVITPILGGSYYHIFNRGLNRQKVFFNEENFKYFLVLFEKYLNPFVSLLAYCLIDNHFHFLIKVKDDITRQDTRMSSFQKDDIPLDEAIGFAVSNQFRRFFISYIMTINNQESRTGNLFDRTFKRLEIKDEEHLKYLAFYIHYNPQKHGIISDFRNYRFSSWNAYNTKSPSKLDRELLLEIFEGKNEFIEYHKYFHQEKEWIELE